MPGMKHKKKNRARTAGPMRAGWADGVLGQWKSTEMKPIHNTIYHN